MDKLTSSIVITTKNRKEELSKAIESCLKLKGDPEIFVFDDGSEDGTFELVQNKYPSVQVYREEISLGLIDARTKAASLVKGDIIFSIDDDAVFSDKSIVFDIIRDFEIPMIGAVAIPFINIKYSQDIKQKAPDPHGTYITSNYNGSAYAIRKDIFLKLGGYRNSLVRQNEESDYCIRMLDVGYFVKLGNSAPIIHYESPKRDKKNIKYYETRNYILFGLQNVPLVFLIFHMTINIFNILRRHDGYLITITKGIYSGIKDFLLNKRIKRKPVTIQTYLLFRKLKWNIIEINNIPKILRKT
jgi:GT2 family glycosyltransferase